MQSQFSRQLLNLCLAAACVAAGSTFSGCDASSDPTQAAQRTAEVAGHKVASAGEVRATDKLFAAASEANGASDIDALQKTVAAARMGEYISQQAAEKDLQAVVADLQSALKGDLQPALKSSLESQLAQAQLALSSARFATLEDDIQALNQQAALLQDLAQNASSLGVQAKVLRDGIARANTAATAAAELAKSAEAQAVAARQVLTDAQSKAKALQDQAAAKKAEADKIYADTEAAFRAADAQKGSAAIAAGTKAMEDRKRADALMQEIGNMAPDIRNAEQALALAQVQSREADATAKAMAEAADSAAQSAKNTAKRQSDMQAAAEAMIENAKGGVKDQYAKLLATAASIEAKAKEAISPADQAVNTFTAAANDYRTYTAKLKEISDPLESSDPLKKIAADNRASAMFFWWQAAAAQQAGRIQTEVSHAAEVATAAAASAQAAFAATGKQPNGALNLDAKAYKEAAQKSFNNALDKLALAAKIPAPKGSDLDKIKWLPTSLEATTQQGLYLLNPTDSQRRAMISAKQNLAALNPTAASDLTAIPDK